MHCPQIPAKHLAGPVFALAVLIASLPAQAGKKTLDTAARSRLAEAYGKLPLRFESNEGQVDGQIKFVAHGNRYTLFLTSSGATLAVEWASVIMHLAGANREARSTGVEELPGTVNYFIGNDPQKRRTNVHSFAKVKYQGVYPGVDLIYYGSQRQLEYDFLVAPGADPRKIVLDVQGGQRTQIDVHGDLVLNVPGGEVRFHKPVIYQQDPGRTPVEGRYWSATTASVSSLAPTIEASRR
jgi:hypothetical protein